MNHHEPNVIPLQTRAILAICALFLLVFIVAELAFGYTFLPTKRGGILLSGIPTLMIATAATALLAAAVLTIIDHYDKRPNEAKYTSLKSECYKTAAGLLACAVSFETLESILNSLGYYPFPSFNGLATHYSIYSPKFKQYGFKINNFINQNFIFIIVLIVLPAILFFILKFFSEKKFKKFILLLSSIFIINLSIYGFLLTLNDLFVGETSTGRYAYKVIIQAEKEPAKFNAVLLGKLTINGFMLFTGCLVLIGTIKNRIKFE